MSLASKVGASAPVAGNKRFTLAPTSAKTSEGAVALGVDRNENEYLVHTVGRQSEAITLEAVAVALTSTVIGATDVAAAFRAAGKLGELEKAIQKAQG
jgi:hypothetical protein